MLYKLPLFLYQSEQPESGDSLFHALRTLQPVEVFRSPYIVQLMHYRKCRGLGRHQRRRKEATASVKRGASESGPCIKPLCSKVSSTFSYRQLEPLPFNYGF